MRCSHGNQALGRANGHTWACTTTQQPCQYFRTPLLSLWTPGAPGMHPPQHYLQSRLQPLVRFQSEQGQRCHSTDLLLWLVAGLQVMCTHRPKLLLPWKRNPESSTAHVATACPYHSSLPAASRNATAASCRPPAKAWCKFATSSCHSTRQTAGCWLLMLVEAIAG
jgi:hypothetical protein